MPEAKDSITLADSATTRRELLTAGDSITLTDSATTRPQYVMATDSITITDSATATLVRAHETLFAEAEQHQIDGRVHEAVVLAQTCCEMVAARAIGALQRDPAHAQADYADLVAAVFPKNRDNTYSMLDSKARAAWRALTGDDLTQASFWKPYEDHVRLRNRIAHRGERISTADCAASITAARDFITHVTYTTNSAIGDSW
jgi:hypothetical protein